MPSKLGDILLGISRLADWLIITFYLITTQNPNIFAMTDPNQEYQSLDELFRKTFDNLPESPAPSGWDVPSDRVWNHVQTNIEPPKTGWTLQTIGLVSAFAVTLAVGLYLYTARTTEQAPVPPPVAPVETPATMPSPSDLAPAVTQPTSEQPAAQPVAKPAKPAAKPKTPPNTAEKNASDAKRPLPTAAPLPGTKPVSPNSTERQRSEGGGKKEGQQL